MRGSEFMISVRGADDLSRQRGQQPRTLGGLVWRLLSSQSSYYFPFFGAGFAGFFAAGFLVILATSFGDLLIAHLSRCAIGIILIHETLSSGLLRDGVAVGGTE